MAIRDEQKKQRNQQSEMRSNQQTTSSETAKSESRSQSGLSRRGQFVPSPWSGGSSFSSLSNEMERLFEDFLNFAGFGRGLAPLLGRREFSQRDLGGTTAGIWSPQIEVFNRGGQFIIRADLPGLTRDDVKVDVRDDALIIQGERRHEREVDDEGFYRSERSYGSFFRSIQLPEGVEEDEIQASFRDGVLEITMPAPQPQHRGRRIEISGTADEKLPKSRSHTAGKS